MHLTIVLILFPVAEWMYYDILRLLLNDSYIGCILPVSSLSSFLWENDMRIEKIVKKLLIIFKNDIKHYQTQKQPKIKKKKTFYLADYSR